MKQSIQALFTRLQKNRYLSWALYGGLLLLALLFYGVGEGWFARAPTKAAMPSADSLEQRLEAILGRIRGAGQVRVLITYDTAGERIAATVSTLDESLSESTGSTAATKSKQTREMVQPATVTTQGGQTPIILVEKEPSIRGVIVVAEGAADPTVRLNLQRAVQAVTGVSISAIEVFEMDYPS